MNDCIGVFIDARYLLGSGIKVLLSDAEPKYVARHLSVAAFKNAVKSIADRISPQSRVLRIYWYESELNDDEEEFARRVALGRNGIKLRTSPHESNDDALDKFTLDGIAEDIESLTNSGAITDAILVTDLLACEDLVDSVQGKGVRVHVLEIEPRDYELTLDLRTCVDTFSPLTVDSLRRFLVPDSRNVRPDQTRSIDPLDYNISVDEIDSIEDEFGTDHVMAETELPDDTEETDYDSPDDYEYDEYAQDDESIPIGPVNSEEITSRVREYAEEMLDHQIRACVQYWSVGRRDVPTTHDKSVLAACREGIQRTLSPEERKIMRDEFMRIVNQIFVQRGLEISTRKPREVGPDRRYSLPMRDTLSPQPRREVDPESQAGIKNNVEMYVDDLNDEELRECLQYWQAGQYGVPSLYDKGVMGNCRQDLGRNLEEPEKHFMRAEFKRITNEIAAERGILQE